MSQILSMKNSLFALKTAFCQFAKTLDDKPCGVSDIHTALLRKGRKAVHQHEHITRFVYKTTTTKTPVLGHFYNQ